MTDEIIDILDDDGNVIGSISRAEAERDNHVTENVLVFVFNSQGRVWVQLRPMTKNHYPGRWDISACGSVQSGEHHAAAAQREATEELGITPALRHVESFLNVFPGDNGEERKRLSHLYVGVSDDQPQTNEEVDEFKHWHPDELRVHVLGSPDAYVPSFIVELDKAVKGHQRLS
jgi:isopentenyl-diphosphate delta-isomerase